MLTRKQQTKGSSDEALGTEALGVQGALVGTGTASSPAHGAPEEPRTLGCVSPRCLGSLSGGCDYDDLSADCPTPGRSVWKLGRSPVLPDQLPEEEHGLGSGPPRAFASTAVAWQTRIGGQQNSVVLQKLKPDTPYTITLSSLYPDVEGALMTGRGETMEAKTEAEDLESPLEVLDPDPPTAGGTVTSLVVLPPGLLSWALLGSSHLDLHQGS
ncbi:hypothetical protein CB1_001262020 [Camelus ferus]|nr:hypothetical protein CB1_001262020 [Camelus ferus]